MRKDSLFTFAVIAVMLFPVALRAQLVLQGTETRVTTADADQFDPAISANVVVYTDFSGVDADVWYTDLATGQAHRVSTLAGDQQLTGVSGGRLAYTDWNTMDVMVFDVTAGTTTNITNAAGSNSLDPAVGGDLVAWTDDRDGNAEIYARNLATGEERRISNDTLVDESPSVDDGIIVWERCDGYACDTYAYDWSAGTTLRLTDTPYASERFPDVDGRVVVYQREQGTPIDKNVVSYNLDSGVEHVLDLAGDQENPHISGACVSYNDSASGQPHIGIWDLASGARFDVPAGAGGQYLNDIDGNRIVYSDNRAGTLDIYLYTFQILSQSPAISVNPLTLAFGEVEMGSSTTLLVTVSNRGTMDLALSDASLAPGSSGAFTMTQAPPAAIPAGGSADVAVTFAPTARGMVSGTLRIASSDPANPLVEVTFDGEGVSAEVPPEEQVENLLQFFDAAVGSGALIGSGPGKSAGNRLKALRNMLEAAGDLIRTGDSAGAYRQLSDALLKTDGQPQPPDFVTGTSAAELARLIRDLMDSL